MIYWGQYSTLQPHKPNLKCKSIILKYKELQYEYIFRADLETLFFIHRKLVDHDCLFFFSLYQLICLVTCAIIILK